MARNVEIKARLSRTEFENIGAIAKKLGSGPQLLIQTDTFFHVHDGRLKLREFADGSAELISYSRADEAEPRLCRYERFAVDDPASVGKIAGVHVDIPVEFAGFSVVYVR